MGLKDDIRQKLGLPYDPDSSPLFANINGDVCRLVDLSTIEKDDIIVWKRKEEHTVQIKQDRDEEEETDNVYHPYEQQLGNPPTVADTNISGTLLVGEDGHVANADADADVAVKEEEEEDDEDEAVDLTANRKADTQTMSSFPFAVHSRVVALCDSDGIWYPGYVVETSDETVCVKCDGYAEWEVKKENVKDWTKDHQDAYDRFCADTRRQRMVKIERERKRRQEHAKKERESKKAKKEEEKAREAAKKEQRLFEKFGPRLDDTCLGTIDVKEGQIIVGQRCRVYVTWGDDTVIEISERTRVDTDEILYHNQHRLPGLNRKVRLKPYTRILLPPTQGRLSKTSR